MRRFIAVPVATATAVFLSIGTAVAVVPFSFGVFRDHELAGRSNHLFGVDKPLDASSSASISQAEAQADPTRLATLAKGLHARVVTTQGPTVDDQISLWPDSKNPKFLIVCNEDDSTEPGLVRIDLKTGAATTIVTGTEECDPTRRTPWGTSLFG
jgi:hypothetical protein